MTLNTMGSSVRTRLLHIESWLLSRWSERGGTPGLREKDGLAGVCEGVPEGPRVSDT